MRIPWYARTGFVAVAAAAAILTVAPSAYANVPLTPISSDTFTNTTSQHATQVEPDTYSFGSTIVMATQTGRFNDGGASDIAFSTSTDNGATWSGGNLPGITKFSGGGRYDRVSDAAVAYDARHNVWMISGLPLLESGGVHGAAITTSRSTDGGHTWGNPVITASGSDLDKNWIVCDNTATSPFYGHCYTQWDDHANGNRIKMSTSTDGGLTWGAALNTSGNATGIGGQPVVQPNGTVVVPMASATETSIRAFRSTNGGASWTTPVTIASVGAHTVPGGLRSGPLPSAEVDGSGKVYVVWQDSRFRGGARDDIVMSTSTNGSTWTTVVRIPIDATSSTVDHFIPGLAVDRATSGTTAHLGLTYYFYPTSSCTASTCRLNVGYISSTNSGSTWTSPTQLAGPMTLSWLANTTQGRMVGDYISTSFDANGLAHGTFAVATAPSGSTFNEAIYTPATGLTAAAGSTAVQTYRIPQRADAALGDLADRVAIALGVEPIG
jgi:hypothetical protein